jgi:hypothetical protein
MLHVLVIMGTVTTNLLLVSWNKHLSKDVKKRNGREHEMKKQHTK